MACLAGRRHGSLRPAPSPAPQPARRPGPAGRALLAPAGRHPTLTDAVAEPAAVAEPRRDAVARLRRRAPYYAYRAGAALARSLPEAAVERLTGPGGAVMASIMGGRRRMLARHLRRLHGPGLDGPELDREVRRSFASYARYWAESFRLPGTPAEALAAATTSEGLGNLDAGLAAGRGVILALPHLGGWDFGGAWLASLGYRMVAVVEPVQPPELFEWFTDLRRSVGLEVLPLGPAAGSTVLRRVKQNAVVALVCDRDIGGSGVDVEFFGERTTLPGGPATLALRTGAALLPSAVFYTAGGGHHAVIGTPLDVTRHGRLRDDVARLTQEIASHLESLIRRAPDQWHLLQPNWPSDLSA